MARTPFNPHAMGHRGTGGPSSSGGGYRLSNLSHSSSSHTNSSHTNDHLPVGGSPFNSWVTDVHGARSVDVENPVAESHACAGMPDETNSYSLRQIPQPWDFQSALAHMPVQPPEMPVMPYNSRIPVLPLGPVLPPHFEGPLPLPVLAQLFFANTNFHDPEVQRSTKFGSFTSELPYVHNSNRPFTRYIRFLGVTAQDFEQEHYSRGVYGNIKNSAAFASMVGVKKTLHEGKVEVRFDSVIACQFAMERVEEARAISNLSWSCSFTTAEVYQQGVLNSSPRSFRSSRSSHHSYNARGSAQTQIHEGELLVRVIVMPVDPTNKPVESIVLMVLRETIANCLAQFGPILAFQYIGIFDGSLHIRVEMDSVIAGDKAVQHIQGTHLTVRHFGQNGLKADVKIEISVEHWDKSQNPRNWLSQDVVQISRSDNNRVDYRRVLAGQDCRTSVMLRDLPNRMAYFEVIRLLETISPGDYDFSYLRIDFGNQHNVGYVFINFIDIPGLLNFMEHVVGRRWQIFSSEKIAQLSYANIQGRECLLERFRNSAVRGQWPAFRPKLWGSKNDDDYSDFHAAPQQSFPHVSNTTKYNRSVDNQTAVGLFSPGAKAPPRSSGCHDLLDQEGLATAAVFVPGVAGHHTRLM